MSVTPVVLQVLPALVSGGVERGTLEVAAALRRNGYTALVASSGGPLVNELDACGAVHLTLPLKTKNPFMIWKNAKRLEQLIRTHGVNIVHARSRAPAWSAYLAARRCGVPFVTTYHAAYNTGNIFRKIYASVMAKGDRVIVISRFIEATIRNTYKLPTARIRLIYRGFDHTRFSPALVSAERIDKLRQSWALPAGVLVILCPGRITRTKGQEVLVRAVALIKDIPFVCVLAGDAQGRMAVLDDLKALAEKLEVADRVIVTGGYTDAPAVMALADIVVTPAVLPEAFGRTTVEAQAMAKYVISTNNGAAPEIITQGQTGWLVEPGDVLALAAALRTFFALDPQVRQQGEQLARTQALTRFSTQVMCEQTLDLYRELLRV